MATGNTYDLLTLEGHLLHASLTHGLTALRAAEVSNKGTFYTAFFQLSIGIERLMKVILVIDHMAKNRMATPTNDALKKKGHDLITLFDYLHSLPDLTPNPLAVIDRMQLPFKILAFLSGYAKRSRYYNLDALASAAVTADPLVEWHRIVEDILSTDVSAKQRAGITKRAVAAVHPSWDRTLIIGQTLEGRPMTLADAAIMPQEHDMTARYAVWHILEIMQPLKVLLGDAVDRSHATARVAGMIDCPVPYMTEFLDFFYPNKKDILTKKKWP